MLEIMNDNSEVMNDEYSLLGVVTAFENQMQAAGDNFFSEISFKQWYAMLTITLFDSEPTINELSSSIGSSHQNVKQLLIRLEKQGLVELYKDEQDHRKIRVRTTDKNKSFSKKYEQSAKKLLDLLYHGVSAENVLTTLDTLRKMTENMQSIDLANTEAE